MNDLKNNNKNDANTRSQEELLKERMQGKLPIIDIAGHPFYVDMRMQTLRPHDDFSTLGIPFSAFDDFEGPDGFAWIPYDSQKHQLKVVSLERITEIPTDWVIIEIAQPWKLDPYGYARDNGFDIKETLKEDPIQENLKARIVSWEEAGIPDLIKENKAKQQPERKRPPHKRVVQNDKRAEKKQGRKR